MTDNGKAATSGAPAKAEEVLKTRIDPKTGQEQYLCQYCGKWIFRDDSVEQGAGDLCHHLRDELGFTEASLIEHRLSMTADVPEGYIKVASLDRTLKRLGIPVSRMVRAMGKDRSLEPALHPKFQPIYDSSGKRWLDPWCGSEEGLNFLRSLGRTVKDKAPDAIEAALTAAVDATS